MAGGSRGNIPTSFPAGLVVPLAPHAVVQQLVAGCLQLPPAGCSAMDGDRSPAEQSSPPRTALQPPLQSLSSRSLASPCLIHSIIWSWLRSFHLLIRLDLKHRRDSIQELLIGIGASHLNMGDVCTRIATRVR